MIQLNNNTIFQKGDPLPEMFSKYFIGQAYLDMLAKFEYIQKTLDLDLTQSDRINLKDLFS